MNNDEKIFVKGKFSRFPRTLVCIKATNFRDFNRKWFSLYLRDIWLDNLGRRVRITVLYMRAFNGKFMYFQKALTLF